MLLGQDRRQSQDGVLTLAQALENTADRSRVFTNVTIYYMALGDLARAVQVLGQQLEWCIGSTFGGISNMKNKKK